MEALGPATAVEMAIDGRAYSTLYGSPRQDVAEHFENPGYLLSGFSVRLDSSLLGEGEHAASLRVILSPGDRYVESAPFQIVLVDIPG
jgi:hypothetical protein